MLERYATTPDTASRRQIDGVRAVRVEPSCAAVPAAGPIAFGSGLEIELDVDELAFQGGSAFLLGCVLEKFFARHASINSFTETVLRSAATRRNQALGAPMGRPDDRVVARLGPSALFSALGERPFEYDFFQLLRRIECAFEDKPRLGTALRPADEPIRLGQDPSLAFAPASLAALQPAKGARPPRLVVSFLGLLGPERAAAAAPDRVRARADPARRRPDVRAVPRHLSPPVPRVVLPRVGQAQPTVRLDRADDDGFAAYVGSLIGIGTRELRGAMPCPTMPSSSTRGWLSRNARNRDGLVGDSRRLFPGAGADRGVRGSLAAPAANASSPASGGGMPARCSAAAPCSAHGSGTGSTSSGSGSGRSRLTQYEMFLPGGTALEKLVAWVRKYFGFELAWDLRLALLPRRGADTRLGSYGRLGWTTWLGRYLRREATRAIWHWMRSDACPAPTVQALVGRPMKTAAH